MWHLFNSSSILVWFVWSKPNEKNYRLDAICGAIRYALDAPKICPWFAQDMVKIPQRYAQKMLKICPSYDKISKTLITHTLSNMYPRDASASKNNLVFARNLIPLDWFNLISGRAFSIYPDGRKFKSAHLKELQWDFFTRDWCKLNLFSFLWLESKDRTCTIGVSNIAP